MTATAVHKAIEDGLKAAIPQGGTRVSQWAAEYRFLSEERSNRYGKWSNDLVPFLVEIMDAFSDPEIRVIAFMKSSQVAGTEFLVNCIGYRIHYDPGPMLFIAEQETKARAFAEEALDPTIAVTPVLRERIIDFGRKTAANNQQTKRFRGGTRLNILWASSPSQLSSRPARDVLCDEVDAFVATGEGNPISLAEARTKTFRETKKIVLVSSPRDAETSLIEPAYKAGDQREYYVPCPFCNEYQVLKWENVIWPEGKPEDAEYRCDVCSVMIGHEEKADMLGKGRWIAGAETKHIASFKISELYSPFTTWADMAVDFLVAKKHTDTLRVFVNTRLGETWKAEETIDYLDLQLHKEPYAAEVPDGVLVLTCGVDVQGDRLEYEIVGWGLNRENWSIDVGVIEGSPSLLPVWDDLDDIIFRAYQGTARQYLVSCTLVDSGGHHTEEVYAYCKKHKGRRVFAAKGSSQPGNPLVKKGSLTKREKVRIWMVGTDTAKDEIFSYLRVDEPGSPGFCHFPNDDERYGDAYIKQLCSEKKVTRFRQGRSYSIYEKVSASIRNEALDLRVYATAARGIILKDFDKWAERQVRRRLKPLPNEQPLPVVPDHDVGDVEPGGQLFPEGFSACKAGCGRPKKGQYSFCCHGCTMAFDGKYEVHEKGPLGHSERCDETFAEVAGNNRQTPSQPRPQQIVRRVKRRVKVKGNRFSGYKV